MPHLYEAYSSIQGEGPYVGVRQTFLRTAGCSLGCVYCDTLDAKRFRPAHFHVEREPGSGTFDSHPNPVDLEVALDACDRLVTSCTHSVSITGGEPMQLPELADLVEGLKARGHDVYLETAGSNLRVAERLAGKVDYLSLDVKLPSHRAVPADNVEDLIQTELSVLKLLRDAGAEAFCKMVVLDATTEAEVRDACERLKDLGVPVVLTPVTPMGDARPATARQVQALARAAGDVLGAGVRVIPQMHRLVGVL